MKPFEPKPHHFTIFTIAIVTLMSGSLGPFTEQAHAEEPALIPPTSESVIASTPATVPLSSQIQAQLNGDTPVPSAAELQNRLNTLQQRLNTINETDLDPISLLLPNISSNVPTAYGASTGMVAVGLGYQNRTRYTDKDDGTAAAVVGLGNPQKLGVDVQVSFLDLSRFGHRVALGFKLHRQLGNGYTVAVGGENSLVSAYSDSGASYYGVVSKRVRLSESSSTPFSRLYLSLGVGNGRFLSEDDVFRGKGGINVFGSAAVNINRSTMAFTEWNGQSLNVGASIVPFRKHPFAITIAAADLAGGAGNGTRFTVGMGYVFTR